MIIYSAADVVVSNARRQFNLVLSFSFSRVVPLASLSTRQSENENDVESGSGAVEVSQINGEETLFAHRHKHKISFQVFPILVSKWVPE